MNAPQQSEKKTLTDQLRVRAAGVIEPIVSVLARLRVSPDLLTLVGMLAHFIVAYLIVSDSMMWAGVVLILIAPLDALDGSLARKIGRAPGGFGAFWDSTLDRLAEVILFGGFVVYYTNLAETWLVVAAYAAVTGSIMVSYTRARAESLGLSCRVGLFSRVERYLLLVVLLVVNLPQFVVIVLAFGTYFTVAQRVVHVWRQTRPSLTSSAPKR